MLEAYRIKRRVIMNKKYVFLLVCVVCASLILGVNTFAQDNNVKITGKVVNRGMYIDMQGNFNPKITLDASPIVFKFTQEEALKYGLIKDGRLVDIQGWNVELIYEKIGDDKDPIYKIISFRKI
jgi:hypothetical protein